MLSKQAKSSLYGTSWQCEITRGNGEDTSAQYNELTFILLHSIKFDST